MVYVLRFWNQWVKLKKKTAKRPDSTSSNIISYNFVAPFNIIQYPMESFYGILNRLPKYISLVTFSNTKHCWLESKLYWFRLAGDLVSSKILNEQLFGVVTWFQFHDKPHFSFPLSDYRSSNCGDKCTLQTLIPQDSLDPGASQGVGSQRSYLSPALMALGFQRLYY